MLITSVKWKVSRAVTWQKKEEGDSYSCRERRCCQGGAVEGGIEREDDELDLSTQKERKNKDKDKDNWRVGESERT